MRAAVLIALLIAGLTTSLPVSAAKDTGATNQRRGSPGSRKGNGTSAFGHRDWRQGCAWHTWP